jgi:2-dehydropantoate 2-reductase
LEIPHARVLMQALVREAETVARAAAIRLPYPDPLAEVERVLRQTAGNQSSMLQDVLRGAPTEIDAITGALLAQAHRLGVPAPVNETIYRMIMVETQDFASLKV